MIVRTGQKALRRLGASPETERFKDVWDLAVFGHGGNLDFTKIHQKPLREAVKAWSFDELPRRRGKSVWGLDAQHDRWDRGPLQQPAAPAPARGGHLPALLERADMVGFCNRLAFLAGRARSVPTPGSTWSGTPG